MRSVCRVAVLLVGVLGVPPAVGAQEARLRMDVDTTAITLGDPVGIRLWVDHPPGWTVDWRDTLDVAPFEVLEHRTSDPVAAGDLERSVANYVLTSFELGELEIPSIEVAVVTPDGSVQTLSTDPFRVGVQSVGLDESGDIRDIKGPLSIARDWVRLLLFVLAVVAALAILARFVSRWRKRPKPEPVAAPPPPPRPFHVLALEALDELQASPLLDRGEVKEYHVRIAEIIRTYIEGQLQVPALELTTGEVVTGLRAAALPDDVCTDVRVFLDRCDLVKFAKYRPSRDDCTALLEPARSLVNRTSGFSGAATAGEHPGDDGSARAGEEGDAPPQDLAPVGSEGTEEGGAP